VLAEEPVFDVPVFSPSYDGRTRRIDT